MGFKISHLLQHSKVSVSIGSLAYKTIAIDGFNALYQFIGITARGGTGVGIEDAMLAFLRRNINLLKNNLYPIYAFEVNSEEALTFRRKRFGQRYINSFLVEKIIDSGIKIVDCMGIPAVRAPLDGEAQAAHIVNKGGAYAVASEDYDTLLYGAKRMVINLYKEPIVIELDLALKELGVTWEQLVDVAVLVGNDFYEGKRNIGAKTAIKLMKEYGTIEEATLKTYMTLKRNICMDEGVLERVRNIFKNPPVNEVYEKLEQKKPRYEDLRTLLVDDLECNPQQVNEALIELKRLSRGKKQIDMESFFS